jgi:hypothetical protein
LSLHNVELSVERASYIINLAVLSSAQAAVKKNVGEKCPMMEVSNEHVIRERECVHRISGVDGEFFSGESFIQALQSLRGEAALKLSRKVGPFFWADAAHIKVWLCTDCAREAQL